MEKNYSRDGHRGWGRVSQGLGEGEHREARSPPVGMNR